MFGKYLSFISLFQELIHLCQIFPPHRNHNLLICTPIQMTGSYIWVFWSVIDSICFSLITFSQKSMIYILSISELFSQLELLFCKTLSQDLKGTGLSTFQCSVYKNKRFSSIFLVENLLFKLNKRNTSLMCETS